MSGGTTPGREAVGTTAPGPALPSAALGSTAVRTTSAGTLLDDGLVGLAEGLASVDDVRRTDGSRVLSLRLHGGLHLDVLPDRGLDLGAAWWAGVPVAWRSPHLVDPGPGYGWEERFIGGLLATCGPDNIGEPRGASGQHGTHHLTRATDVRWWREREGDEVTVHVRGEVGHSTLYGTRLVVSREIVVRTGTCAVEVHDVVRNDGHASVGVPLLYHVNLGAPLLRPGARLLVDAPPPAVRDALPAGRSPLVLPDPAPGAAAVVAEHRPRAAVARLTGTGHGVDVEVRWTGDTLPRLCTWAWPASGAWVLGVEPTNAPLFGSERDQPHAGAPLLEPGASWRTGVTIAVVPTADEEDA